MADDDLPEAATNLIAFPCVKCGQPVLVDKAIVPEGASISVSHDKCQREEFPKRRFKVLISIYEIFEPTETEESHEQPVAGFGEEVLAPTFQAALPDLSAALGRLWERVAEHAPIADPVAPPEAEPPDPLSDLPSAGSDT